MIRTLPIVAAFACLALGCAAETEEEDTEAAGSELSRREDYSGVKLNKNQVATHVRNAGFPARLVWPMVCTAYYESKFDVGALGHNSRTSIDHGLFQINSLHLRGEGTDGCPTAAADLDRARYLASLRTSTPRRTSIFDPATNARCAYGVYKDRDDGLNAWNAYKEHKRECDAATSAWVPRD